jgi:hypothetical protein
LLDRGSAALTGREPSPKRRHDYVAEAGCFFIVGMARQAEAGYVEIAFAMIVEAMTPGLAATSMSIEVVWGTNIAVEFHASQQGVATRTSTYSNPAASAAWATFTNKPNSYALSVIEIPTSQRSLIRYILQELRASA